jgi:hypothetical protein
MNHSLPALGAGHCDSLSITWRAQVTAFARIGSATKAKASAIQINNGVCLLFITIIIYLLLALYSK